MSSPMRRSAVASSAPSLLSAALLFTSATSGLCFVAPGASPSLLRGMALSSTSSRSAPPRATVLRRAGGLRMAQGEEELEKPRGNPWLRTDTRGGVLVWSVIATVAPFLAYGPISSQLEDPTQAGCIIAMMYTAGRIIAMVYTAGRIIAMVYTVLLSLAWTFSYVYRVGTKDMTYTKQLKDYEDAVIAKRFEELQEDEVEALLDGLENPPGFNKPDGSEPPVVRGSGWRPDQY
ncbi:hypothetical protein T484DRAFT_1820308 [Baffinella frigidus]|nr:hypothetical protein T484DRAFT_1820308 [Cryptophyta sp. CCMP2293]